MLLDVDPGKIESSKGTRQGALNVFNVDMKERLNFRLQIIKGNLSREVSLWHRRLRHPKTWLYLGAVAFGFLGLVTIFTYVVFASALGSKETLVNAKNTGTILYDRNGKVIYTTEGAHDVAYVSFDKIAKPLKDATIAVEDKDFYSHGGFSFEAILRSIYANFLNGDPTRYGGSTITQQLVKNALLSPHKDFLRKFQEFVLSIEVDRRYSKDEILEMYLNSVYYGAGAYGVENAAQTYFGKDAGNVDLPQSAQLAALPVAPSALSPTAGGDKDAAKARQELVLGRMADQGYITSSQRDQAKKQTFVFLSYKSYKPSALNISPHFALYILDQLTSTYGEDYVGRSGLRVTTSLDLDLQNIAEKALKDQVARLKSNHASNAAMVAMDPKTGQILAMVGSADYENDAIDGKVNVVFADRQPGSSIKPIFYLKALENRQITAATVMHDVPTDFGGRYRPLDYDRKFRGDILVRFALGNSLNIPAVEMLKNLGVDSALEMAHRLRISTLNDPSRYGLSLVLGGGEVKLFDLTRAYGVMANYGNYVDSTPILKIVDKSGNTVFTPNPRKENLVDSQYTYIMSNILSDPNARAMEFGINSILRASHPAAVKTGTTENFRDAWTIGYTPNLVTGVWMGNNDGSFMDSIAGSLGPAPIWRNFMEQAEARLGWEDFKVPAGIQSQLVCTSSGLKSHGTSTGTYTEVFALGTVPDGWCDELPPPPPEATPSGNDNTGGGTNVATPPANPVGTSSGTASGPATPNP